MGDSNKAIEYTKNMISKLLQNKVELVKRMRKRGDNKTYKTGDRVSYVITKGSKRSKAFEKAEDPLYALENTVALDTDYYLKNQLDKPLTRIFEPILGEQGVKQVLHGDHTRNIKVTTSTV